MKSRTDLWHFVFAPNPKSSMVAKTLKKLRGVPTVQTIASPPKSFEGPERLLFGDAIVAQSRFTKQRFEATLGEKSDLRIEEIPPPSPLLEPPSEERIVQVRNLIPGLTGPLFLYPGDLEVSRGADRVVEWSRALADRIPGARVVVAYRDKTADAVVRAEELASRADSKVVSFLREVPDIHALVAASSAVLFPVEDLYGKVDLPIILLEAMRLRVPVMSLNEGPLASLAGALRLPDSATEWIDVAARLASDEGFRNESIGLALKAIDERYAPEVVAARYEALYLELLSSRASR